VAPEGLLGEDPAPVDFDLERAARRLDQLYVRVRVVLADFSRQTGSPGLVVSNDAVLDRYTHSG
jgi:hypothetical protein